MSLTDPQQLRQPLLDPHGAMIRPPRHHRLAERNNNESHGLQDNDDENDDNGDGLFRVTHQHLSAVPRDDPTNLLPWYKQRHQLSAMISNFSTSYNVVNVSLVLPILKVVLSQSRTQESNESWSTEEAAWIEDAEAAVASSLLAGMMLGQILGGILGDVVGASLALRCVMLLQILASIGSSCSNIFSSSSSTTIYWYLATWRFLLGIGAGGVYPLAAVLSTETDSQQHRHAPVVEENSIRSVECTTKVNDLDHGPQEFANDTYRDDDNDSSKLHRVVLTFSTQGVGFLMVPLVTVPLLYLIPTNLTLIWRLILGLGCVPGVFLLLWQWSVSPPTENAPNENVPFSPSQEEISGEQRDDTGISVPLDCAEELVENSARSDDFENESILDSVAEVDIFYDSLDGGHVESLPLPAAGILINERKSLWDSIRSEDNLLSKLLGTAATWFLFDVLFYGNTLFQPIVIEAAFGAREHSNPIHLLQRTALDSLILTSIALPGYIVASFVLGTKTSWCYCGIEQSPRFVMLQGFAAMAILYLTIGTTWDKLRQVPSLLVLLYSLTFFFANYGPNTTTFVLPSIVFAPECRSTFNGLSAAAGKLGALTGASLFEPAADRLGDSTVMLVCAFIAVIALVMTKSFVPSSLNYSENHMESSSSARSNTHVRVPVESDIL